MNDKEENAFRLCYQFYRKYREMILETDGQWSDFAKDVGQLGEDLDIDNNPLGWNLMTAVLETFNCLYRGGNKPLPANYFGRDDL